MNLRWLAAQELARCRFEILTLDDRPLARNVGELKSNDHRSMTAVLNQAYASHWGYSFNIVHWNWSRVRRSRYRRFHPAWGKVFFLHNRLRELEAASANGAEGASACTWLLYLDSDAYVREFDVPLPIFLQGLAERYASLGSLLRLQPASDGVGAGSAHAVAGSAQMQLAPGAIFTRERSVAHAVDGNFRPRRAWINSGVFLLRAGKKAAMLIDDWLALGDAADDKLRHAWPWDQVALTELLRPGAFPWTRWSLNASSHNLSGVAALVDMVEMNSPWGRFVQHLWAGTTGST
eukprot:TRINITY_DN47214_c0_g1_i1.p1 TRINITY_DN47214_c0_g1~~TRINITY_DN47214_c0_g1_i1.p1  ORF type:complete len:292 (-),score=39.39 TRINITY_DN47214_c0_g1_i1:103-978(-)